VSSWREGVALAAVRDDAGLAEFACRSDRTLEEIEPHRCCSSRKVGSAVRGSHRIRSAQRRLSRSSSAMIGRPAADPRTGVM
jgi:hypothetical protein